MFKPSEFKMLEPYNSMPEPKAIQKVLKAAGFNYVDHDQEYWKNKEDTVVVCKTLAKGLTTEIVASETVKAYEAADSFSPDELDSLIEEDETNVYLIFRLWWD